MKLENRFVKLIIVIPKFKGNLVMKIFLLTQKSSMQINIPSTGSNPINNNQPLIPTPYDYLALVPALITAVTPLILGLRQKSNSKSKLESKSNKSSDENKK